MTFRELTALIKDYEHWQQLKLKQRKNSVLPCPHLCNGQVQFASVENARNSSSEDSHLPIVVGLGINFAQNPGKCTAFEPYLGPDPSGKPNVVDRSGSVMRRMLDLSFDAYAEDPHAWMDRKLASAATLKLGQQRDYLLVATNFCPMITYEKWQDYWEPYRADLLNEIDPDFTHLNDLHELLGSEPLWVAHGIGSEVPVLSRHWLKKRMISRWLLTCNLSGQTGVSIKDLAMRPLPATPVCRSDILDNPIEE